MNALSARAAIDQSLLTLKKPDEIGEYLQRHGAQLADCAFGDAAGLALARSYSDLVDSVIRRMLTLACDHAGKAATCEAMPIAIVATGGYGRRELCLHSDIDITFIPHRDGDPVVDRIIKEMFGLLMRVFIDANGMSVGYAYRLLQDCNSLDHQTASGLLDARLITGSDRLFIQFENDFWAGFNPTEFLFTKLDERQRHREKHGATPRVVEPDLKEGAGGLRDLHTAVWLTQALHNLPAARVRGDRSLDVLVREAEVTSEEAAQLRNAKEFLFRVRNALHAITNAERDQLVITRQEEVAERLGYTYSTDSRGNGQHPDGDTPAVERFMRDYYTHATAVDRITGRVMRQAERERLLLGIGLDCVDRQIVPANPALEYEDPVWMLWACELAQRYGLAFSDELERAILELLGMQPVVRDTTQAAELFTRILASPVGAYSILQRMADLGILGWLLPEVGDTLNLISYDPSHDYTVGQHTLFVIRNLDALHEPDGSEEMREYRQIMAELPHPEHLYLAALLHDAGKAMGDRPHSEVGEELAHNVCRRLQWPEEATATVCFLVRHHLLMAETSRLRDINLDETIRDFAHAVGDLDRLHMLYVLTYADTSAVGAGVWTQVKGRFMRDLLHRTQRALTEGEPEGNPDDNLMRTRRRLLKELAVENLPAAEVEEYIGSMPAVYLLNSSLDEMALHIGLVRRARTGEPTVDFMDERDTTYTEVTVCTLDEARPGLLAKIAGVFYAADLDVHSAQVFTRVSPASTNGAEERIAIDKFFVDFRGRQLTSGKRAEISANLTAVLQGKTNVDALLAKRRKTTEANASVKGVAVRNDLSDTYSVVEVSSSDERSLLYRASTALSSLGWDIHSARASSFKGTYTAGFYLAGLKELSEAEIRRRLMNVMPVAQKSAAEEARVIDR